MKKINLTFLIPTYQNLKLLRRYLPSVIKQAQAGDTILISEDSVSSAQAANYFQTQYHLAEKTTPLGKLFYGQIPRTKINFQFLWRRQNGRFARNVNDAVTLVTTPYFLLLNDDVKLRSGVRAALLKTITSAPKIFAVGAKELDVNQNCQCSGRNKLWWRAGRFWHARAPAAALAAAGDTAWVCGGSGLYDTKIWRQLGGFDPRYYPAYWEDIDLSFTARRRGYRVLYEPSAVVEHHHETTNSEVFGAAKMTEMSWRGGSKFAWKNGSWWQRAQFLLAYPYWQLKQFPQLRLWLLVLGLALVSRLALVNVPAGLTVDEAAIAYNGLAIWQQRRDEWLAPNSLLTLIKKLVPQATFNDNILPLSFRSFGDYKAPLAIYVTGFFVRWGGSNLIAVRLPFALASVATIWYLMLLTSLLTSDHYPGHRKYAAAVGLLVTLLPWTVHFGHLGFENNFALLFLVAGLYYFLRGLKNQRPQTRWSGNFVAAALAWSGALYSYHSAKITVPLLALGLGFFYRRQLAARWRELLAPVFLALILLGPLIYDSVAGAGLTRAETSFLVQSDLTAGEKIFLLGQGLSAHLQLSFLSGGRLDSISSPSTGELVPNLRHGDSFTGVLHPLGLVLAGLGLLSGLGLLVSKRRPPWSELAFLGSLTFFAGLVPAVITTSVPHPNRAYLAVLGIALLLLTGLVVWRHALSSQFWRQFNYSWLYLLVVGQSLLSLFWLNQYLSVFGQPLTPLTAPTSAVESAHRTRDYLFAPNLLEALQVASTYLGPAEQIVVSPGHDHPYLYALLATRTPPIAWQNGALVNWLFIPQLTDSDWRRRQTLFVVAPAQIPPVHQTRLNPVQLYYNQQGEATLGLYLAP